MSVTGCNSTAKKTTSESHLLKGDVTLLWNDILGDASYNVYVSMSPGVTKSNGFKISNVTNPVRINQLEHGKTYYFVVTVVDRSGESKESKELSYHAVADKIGLIYWGDLVDQSVEEQKPIVADAGQEVGATPEENVSEPKILPMENEPVIGELANEENYSSALDEENLQPPTEKASETAGVESELAEDSNQAAVAAVTAIDRKALELDEARLKAAKKLADSQFFIFFEQNSNELSPQAIEKLDRIYEIMTGNSDANLILNGYSDSDGSSSYNQLISEVRASSVKSYLTGKGIIPSRIKAFGHGAQKFLASNRSAEGRRFNRRVEIELLIP
jgi:outer membrane protein OmpA-like peptidoglycan-associated protein